MVVYNNPIVLQRADPWVLKERIDGRDPNADKPGEKVFRKVASSLVVRQSTKLPIDSLVL